MPANATGLPFTSLISLLTLAAAAIASWLFWKGAAGWRRIMAYALTAVATALALSLLIHHHPAATTGKQAAVPVRHPIPAPPPRVQKQKLHSVAPETVRRRSAAPIDIIALSNGMVSIQENGKIYTLHVGQSTPGGWRLLSASTLRAELLRPDGKRYIYRP